MSGSTRIIVLLFTIAISGAFSPRLHAQYDIRLSAPRERSVLLPGGAVATAARIDTVTLVAWGSSRREPDSSLVSTLVVQAIAGASPVGTPTTATGPDARPSGYAQVVPLGDRFALFWNDLRGGDSAAYMRIIGLDGTLKGEELRFTEGWIYPTGAFITPRGDGYTIFWSDAAGPILSRQLDAMGLPAGVAGWFADGRIVSWGVAPDSSGDILIDRGDLAPLLLSSEGDRASLGSADSKFSATSYHLAADGSVVTLSGDSVRIFTSYLDDVPARVTVAPRPYGSIPGTGIVSRDSAGRIVVFHVVGGGSASGPSEILRAQLLRTVEESPGRWSAMDAVAGVELGAPRRSCEHVTADVGGVERLRGHDNLVTLTVTFTGLDVSACPDDYSARPVTTIFTVLVGSTGDMLDHPSPPHIAASPVKLRRVTTSPWSELAVSIGGSELRLRAPSARQVMPYPCLLPGLHEDHGRIAVSWLVAGEDTAASTGIWDPRVLDVPIAVETIDLPSPADSGMAPTRRVEMLRIDGQSIVDTRWEWSGPDGKGGEIDHHVLDMMIPTDSGWRRIVHVDTSGGNISITRLSHAFDPARHETIVSWGVADSAGLVSAPRLLAVDASGERRWGTDSLAISPTRGFHTIPIGYDELGIVDQQEYVHLKGNSPVGHVSLAISEGRFIRMIGRSILRASIDTNVSASILTLDGVLRKPTAVILRGAAVAPDVFVVQNPTDSTISFLWGSDNGVRMATFDQSLRLKSSPRIVSDRGFEARDPAAFVRNDSLFVVWRSARQGTSEVYGRVIPMGPPSGVESDPVAIAGARFGEGIAVAPNPAREAIAVRVDPAWSFTVSARYELLDLLGNVRMSVAGDPATPVVFDTAALPDGAYIVRVTCGDRALVTRFIVLH